MRFKNYLGVAFLILLAAGSQPAIGAFWQWSKTSTNNATADPSINWSEGMSPSSVNDSGRAMMARSAEQRDDMSGLLVTTGSSTAYAVTTNQGIQTPTPVDGQALVVTMNVTNGANPTLSADSGTSYPIQTSPGVAVPTATLIAGTPYGMKFSLSNSAWMLRDFYAQTLAVPIGGLVPYTLTTVPNSNFVFAAGQCLSTTTYATYWALLGSPGIGTCAAGQFRIIDMSGNVPAGLDTMPGFSAANRLTSSGTGCGTAMTTVGASCANGSQSHTMTTGELVAHSHPVTVTDGRTWTFPWQRSGLAAATGVGASSTDYNQNGTTGVSPSGSITGSSSNTGSSTPFAVIQPTTGVTYILRVL